MTPENQSEPVTNSIEPSRDAPKTDAERAKKYREKKKAVTIEPSITLDPAEEPPVQELRGETPQPSEPVEQPAIDISRPPKRIPLVIKTRWLSLAPDVREGIIARGEEFNDKFKRYQGLREYAIQAEANGRTLKAVFDDYVGMETAFRSDPLESVIQLWSRLGYDPAQLAPAFAEKYLPDGLAKAFETGRQAGYAEGMTAGAIQQFAAAHQDFESLRPAMARLASADPNLSIEQLYDQAKWTDPISREAEIMKRQSTPTYRNAPTARAIDRARMASKATMGSPSQQKPKSYESTSVHPEGDVRAAGGE